VSPLKKENVIFCREVDDVVGVDVGNQQLQLHPQGGGFLARNPG